MRGFRVGDSNPSEYPSGDNLGNSSWLNQEEIGRIDMCPSETGRRTDYAAPTGVSLETGGFSNLVEYAPNPVSGNRTIESK